MIQILKRLVGVPLVIVSLSVGCVLFFPAIIIVGFDKAVDFLILISEPFLNLLDED